MRKAARISEKIQTYALDHARPGLRKNELAAGILSAGIVGRGRGLGRLPRHRAADAVGRRRRRART